MGAIEGREKQSPRLSYARVTLRSHFRPSDSTYDFKSTCKRVYAKHLSLTRYRRQYEAARLYSVQPSPVSACAFVIACKWAETCRLRCMPRHTTHQPGAHALSMITMTPPLVTSRRLVVVSRLNSRDAFAVTLKNSFIEQLLRRPIVAAAL